MTTEIKDFSQLPLTLTVEEVGRVLGIGRVKAYELANQEGFPTLRLGKRLCVPKQAFLNWINANTGVVA